MEQVERDDPSGHKVLDDRTIYNSWTMPVTYGAPLITDFGSARLGEPDQKYTGDVMPNFYRAPEVILGMQWDSKIDIWSLGLMVSGQAFLRIRWLLTFGNEDLGLI